MDMKKRRSSLRKLPSKDDEDTTRVSAVKRRISFSGKKFVREFDNTEKPKNWDNSYEVSDHLTEDSSGQSNITRESSTSKTVVAQRSLTPEFNKENIPLPTNSCGATFIDRTQSDLTLHLQSSINVTLLPLESNMNAKPLTMQNEFMMPESFSLSDVGREKLHTNRYSLHDLEKTIDLMPRKLTQPQTQNSFVHNNRQTIHQEVCMELNDKTNNVKSIYEDCSMDLENASHNQGNAQQTIAMDSFMDTTPCVNEDTPLHKQHHVESELRDNIKDLHQKVQRKTISKPSDMNLSSKDDKQPYQNTKVFENVDMDLSFDFSLNDDENHKLRQNQEALTDANCRNKQVNAKEASSKICEAETSFDFKESSTFNYLEDDSMVSSPLIPLDILSANCIKKKLNFRQLNDEIGSGRIQIFPNGPKTPTTDCKPKLQRFWEGIGEDLPQDKVLTKFLKPRGTLNFTEDMTMSPPQKTDLKQTSKMDITSEKHEGNRKDTLNPTRREIIFNNVSMESCADDNKATMRPRMTSHAVEHIKEETLSPSNDATLNFMNLKKHSVGVTQPKSRQTTYFTKTMDETQFNNIGAISGITELQATKDNGSDKHRHTLHLHEAMDEDFLSPTKEAATEVKHTNNISPQAENSNPLHNKTNMLPTNEEIRVKQCNKVISSLTVQSKSKRGTICEVKNIEIVKEVESNVLQLKEVHNPNRKPPKSKRSSIYEAVDMELDSGTNVENLCPVQNAAAEVKHTNGLRFAEKESNAVRARPRQTLQVHETMVEEYPSPLSVFEELRPIPLARPKPRQTFHEPENMDETFLSPIKNAALNDIIEKKDKGRQTLRTQKAMDEEFLSSPLSDKPTQTKDLKGASERSKQEPTKSQQTLNMQEIDEPKDSTAQMTLDKCAKPRQTLHMHEVIDDIEPQPVQTARKLRQTLHMYEEMDEQFYSPPENITKLVKSKPRETLHEPKGMDETFLSPIKDAPTVSTNLRNKPRQTVHLSEAMDEEFLSPLKNLSTQNGGFSSNFARPKDAAGEHSKSQQSLRMKEIMDDKFSDPTKSKPRETLHEPLGMDETFLSPIKDAPTVSTNLRNKPRQTVHLSEAMDEEFLSPLKNPSTQSGGRPKDAPGEHSKSRQTLHMNEIMDDKFSNPIKSKPRETLHEPVGMDETFLSPIKDAPTVSTNLRNKPRQTVHLSEAMDQEFLSPLKSPSTQNGGFATTFARPKDAAGEHSKSRQTLHMNEIMDDKFSNPTKPKPRETLHEPVGMDETFLSPIKDAPTVSTNLRNKPRQTVHLSEAMDEEFLSPVKNPSTQNRGFATTFARPKDAAGEHSKSRQTLHLNEIMDDKISNPTKVATVPKNDMIQTLDMHEEMDVKSVNPSQSTAGEIRNKRVLRTVTETLQPSTLRQTLYMHEEIDEEQVMPSGTKPRQTLHEPQGMDEEVLNATKNAAACNLALPACTKPRQTYHEQEGMDETFLSPVKDAPDIDQNKPRQTIHVPEDIHAEGLRYPQSTVTSKNVLVERTKPRQTLHTNEAMDETVPASTLQFNGNYKQTKPVSCFANRHTMHINETIDEDILNSSKDVSFKLPAYEKYKEKVAQSKPSQTICNNETIDEDFQRPNEDTNSKTTNKIQLNETYKTNLLECTPVLSKTRQTFNIMYSPYTPARSLLAFEEAEEECNSQHGAQLSAEHNSFDKANMSATIEGVGVNESNCAPNYQNVCHTKRSSQNLTPNMPLSKKRHTLIFTERPIDEEAKELLEQSHYKDLEASRQKMQHNSNVFINKSQSGELNTSKQTMQQDTPVSRNKSRIPVLAKKGSNESPKSIDLSKNNDLQEEYSVQVPRKYVTRQTKSVFELPELEIPKPETPKASTLFDGNPITISDVSGYFLAKKSLSAEQQLKHTYVVRESRSSNETDFKSIAAANRNYINLSNDTSFFAAELISNNQKIDNERLSLVSTLLDDEDNVDVASEQIGEAEVCERSQQSTSSGGGPTCRKCKRCKCSLSDTQTTTDSFSLSMVNFAPDFSKITTRLPCLRQRPRIADVHKYWEYKSLERYSNLSDELTNADESCTNLQNELSKMNATTVVEKANQFDLDLMVAKYKSYVVRYKSRVNQTNPQLAKPFYQRLEHLVLAQAPNWIFDYQMECPKKYIFSHRKISTFHLAIYYNPVDALEREITISSIAIDSPPRHHLPASWSALEHLQDFQIQLKLPFNLTDAIDGNDEHSVLKLLQQIDALCLEVRRTCQELISALSATQARLLRETNRTVVRKFVRTIVEHKPIIRVEKTKFLIQIGNLEQLSYKDILQPPLYKLNEDIEFLPKGVDFLKAFLSNPVQYLKQSN